MSQLDLKIRFLGLFGNLRRKLSLITYVHCWILHDAARRATTLSFDRTNLLVIWQSIQYSASTKQNKGYKSFGNNLEPYG